MVNHLCNWGLIIFLSALSIASGYGQKSAYKHYYKGALCYLEAQMESAEAHFKRAVSQVPDNFYFATAYGMTLHRTGHYAEGKAMLQRAGR